MEASGFVRASYFTQERRAETLPHRGLPKCRCGRSYAIANIICGLARQAWGFFRLSPHGKIEHYFAEVGNSFIRGFLEGRDGSIWIATEGGMRATPTGRRNIIVWGQSSSLVCVFLLPKTTRDRFGWVRREGYSFQKWQLSAIRVSQTLQGHSVYALYFDATGVLWVEPITACSCPWNTVFHFLPEGQNSFHTVYQILSDKGALWIACPTHVYRWSWMN